MRAAWAYFASWPQLATEFAPLSKTKLTMPVLSIGGEKSLGNELGAQMKRVADNVTVIVLPNTGHWILEEKLCCGSIVTRVPKRSRHPNKFVEKFVHASGVSRISNFARGRIEELSRGTKVNIREDRNQAELTQDRQQTLDHARTAEWTG
jgi:hypothetical protein